jgi:hypothetical protein
MGHRYKKLRKHFTEGTLTRRPSHWHCSTTNQDGRCTVFREDPSDVGNFHDCADGVRPGERPSVNFH